ncbi:MAG: hypothetical protein Q4C75_06015 [Bergeyella zoohelcum]|nr:hypothetical protein [Bergeyella zoohelcum]
MKKQLSIYAVLVFIFIAYNSFFQVKDERLNTLINIIYTSVLFLYIGYIAWVVLKKIGQQKKK